MMDTKQLDDRVGMKIPHLKNNVMNFLRVVDLAPDDRNLLRQMGYGELLGDPTSAARGPESRKEQYNLELEA